jgi:hypothetical protein
MAGLKSSAISGILIEQTFRMTGKTVAVPGCWASSPSGPGRAVSEDTDGGDQETG